MFRVSVFLCTALLLVAVPVAVQAQDDDPPGPYIYGTYSVCDLSEQWKLDGIVEGAHAKVYDKAMEDGLITGWGYMGHHTGGNWRRITYYMAPNLEDLMAAADTIFDNLGKAAPQAANEYSRICSTHDDYVWEHVAGSDPGGDTRGKAAFSVYYICDEGKEARADEIMQESLAAAYDKQLKAGNLDSWGWYQHWIGGKYRRLATVSGADHASVLKARDAVISDMLENHAAAMEEFSSICSSHQDYMWDIIMAKP
jgi:hypothetical protein